MVLLRRIGMFVKVFRQLCRYLATLQTDRSALILANSMSRNMSSKDNEGNAHVQETRSRSRSRSIPGNVEISEGKPESSVPSEEKSDDMFRPLSNADVTEEDVRRSDLQNKALSFLPSVLEMSLTPHQVAIHKAHVRALKAGEVMYEDPDTGYQVMSRLAHLFRGDCCGNACRHCPFGQKNVPEESKNHTTRHFMSDNHYSRMPVFSGRRV